MPLILGRELMGHGDRKTKKKDFRTPSGKVRGTAERTRRVLVLQQVARI
jgi:hypothetical protein